MNLFLAKSYWRYYWRARTIYNTDSAFLLDFYQNVWQDDRQYYAFSDIELYRRGLLASAGEVSVTDLGAGSHKNGLEKQRKVADIARYALSPKWECEFLFRLVNWLAPQIKIEMGTSLGVSTLYQHIPNARSSQFFTLEGCPNIAALAGRKLAQYAPIPTQIIGNFDDTLPELLTTLPRVDYVFIDGNHRKEPTLRYFEQCMSKATDKTVFVFDDIYWSAEMAQAWATICADPRLHLTIDLFKMGVAFVNPTNSPKQNLTLIPFRYKPWRIGIFR